MWHWRGNIRPATLIERHINVSLAGIPVFDRDEHQFNYGDRQPGKDIVWDRDSVVVSSQRRHIHHQSERATQGGTRFFDRCSAGHFASFHHPATARERRPAFEYGSPYAWRVMFGSHRLSD
jgi:hypothetical protein